MYEQSNPSIWMVAMEAAGCQAPALLVVMVMLGTGQCGVGARDTIGSNSL